MITWLKALGSDQVIKLAWDDAKVGCLRAFGYRKTGRVTRETIKSSMGAAATLPNCKG